MYHSPVLLKESIDELQIKRDGIYLDLTFGGGGHSREILQNLSPRGHLYAFDQDAEAVKEAGDIADSENFTLFKANSRYLKYFLNFYSVDKADGILVDLGVASHQLDDPSRGFSTRFDGPLDMRMNIDAENSAMKIVNEYSKLHLQSILSSYGEVKNAARLAEEIVRERSLNKITSTKQLCDLLQKFAPSYRPNKYYAQVFQAFRIEVNQELEALKEILKQSAEFLKPEGRLVVISYHSLEDRLVKRFIKNGNFEPHESSKDLYGNVTSRLFVAKNKKPIEASPEELGNNSRARSAKMRVAARL